MKNYSLTLLVLLAFGAMVFFSYWYVSGIENRHLIRNADDAFDNTWIKIEADLQEPKSVLAIVSQTVRSMVRTGNSSSLQSYFFSLAELFAEGEFLRGFDGIYGHLYKYGNFDGWGRDTPEDHNVTERSWYLAAVKENGKIAMTEPYANADGEIVLTYSRLIFDENNMPLGVIALDVKLDRIGKYAVETHTYEGSYGILTDSRLNVIAHPSPNYYLGMPIVKMNDGPAIKKELEQGKKISGREVTDYLGRPCVMFIRQMDNGWYMAVLTPQAKYHENLRNMMEVLLALAFISATVLSFVLVRVIKIAMEKMRKVEIAEASNKAKGKFLAVISHEIRTPMNAILGVTEIQLQNEDLPASVKDAFYKIYNSGDLLLGIINDILDLSRIEMNRMESNPVKYELASLIDDAVHLNMMRCSKPIEFSLNVDENTPSLLFGDELRIKQILNNLLSNAYKYTEKGTIKLSVCTEAANTEEGYTVLVFRVSDTGQGMTDEQVEKLFSTEYTRFNLNANRSIEGVGLGMSITYQLVKLMKGNIYVESKPGEGTTVTVRLPQKTLNSGILGKELAENLQSFRMNSSSRVKKLQIMREYMPYGKVLIVDDVESNLYVARGLMLPYGLSIDVATSGPQAIEKIKSGKVYDIVFMDHMMPKMDGIEAVRIIRELGYTHTVIALTANAVAGQSKLFLENGFDEFISKPIDIRQLNAVLNKFIRNKQTPEIISEARRQKQSLEEFVFKSESLKSDPILKEVFLLDVKNTLPVIENTLKNIDNASEEDFRQFTVAAHSMKSALANVGENIASKLALALEKAGREKNEKAIKMQTPVLIDDILSIKAKIESEAKKNSSKSQDNAEGTPGFLKEQLRIICDACVNYDERPVKTALFDLKKLSWSKEIMDLIEKIDEQMLYGDFEEVRKLANVDY
jgi:signal transduction histidine kinase/CheY-like chemotaxis protein/HPt (histidine-containing phosphotransfer) domain-containing protein